jgi:TonB family protein
MSETWKQWEGRTVAGRFPLQSYLGGSDHSAVFLTRLQSAAGDSEKAALKLISVPADAEKQLLRWKLAGELNHPNLISIFEAGRCELDGADLLYVVEEYADENLSQILPERALTAEEAQAMLPPVLRALQFVHDQGFVHGHIHPANILAIGDQVKLSSDALEVPGETSRRAESPSAYDPPEAVTVTGAVSTAADVWQLGMTLVEVLTQRLPVWGTNAPKDPPTVPAAVPEPFREIAGRCLQMDPAKRCTIAEIMAKITAKINDRLESASAESALLAPASAPTSTIAGQRKESAKWPYWLGLAALVAVAFFLIVRQKPSSPPTEVQSTQAQQAMTAENSQPATEAKNPDNQSGVVRRVMPRVSPNAPRTIQGRIKVRVNVEVDAAGNVGKATLESAGPSKYFSRVALEAARDWKFSPAQTDEQAAAREWRLQFAFSRSGTEASAVRTARQRVASKSRD